MSQAELFGPPLALVHGWEATAQRFTCGATRRPIPAGVRGQIDRRSHPSLVDSPERPLERDEQFCPECVRRLAPHAPASAPAPAGRAGG